MKKNIVFIMSDYLPCKSANGLVVSKVVNILQKHYNVSVVCMRTEHGLPSNEINGSHNIIRVDVWEYKSRYEVMKRINDSSNPIVKKFYIGVYSSLKVIKYLKAILSYVNIRENFVDSYINALKVLDSQTSIDAIIPVCFPFESVLAALVYKEKYNSNIKIIPYLFDKFASSETLHRSKSNRQLKFKRHLSLEERMIIESEKILVSYDWESHLNTYFQELDHKIEYIDIPSIEKIESNETIEFDNKRINLVYAGGLDKTNRSPSYSLSLLEIIFKFNPKTLVHFYSRGNCEEILTKYQENNINNFIAHGSVTVDAAHAAMKASQILLSIGNLDVSQKPSKIFEYMSCGKPIIHLYNCTNDPVISILNKYPKAICLDQKVSLEENAKKVLKFIYSNDGAEPISFSLVQSKFFENTPEYFYEVFQRLI